MKENRSKLVSCVGVLCRCLVSVPVFLRCGKEGART